MIQVVGGVGLHDSFDVLGAVTVQVDRRLPLAGEVLSRPADAETVELRVWAVPDVLVIFRAMVPDEIDFDVDRRELQGKTGVDTLCNILRAIDRLLTKPGTITPEDER